MRFARWRGWLTPAQSGDYTLGAPGGATASIWTANSSSTARSAAPLSPVLPDLHLTQGRRYAITVDNAPSAARSVKLVWTHKDPARLRHGPWRPRVTRIW